ncbi:MAG: hypothetical protein WAL91_04060, partial [Propionicimonas sp.]
MNTSDLGPILEDLAAGRINASEAARRIDAIKAAAPAEQKPAEPSNEELAAADAAQRRQYPTHARDVF